MIKRPEYRIALVTREMEQYELHCVITEHGSHNEEAYKESLQSYGDLGFTIDSTVTSNKEQFLKLLLDYRTVEFKSFLKREYGKHAGIPNAEIHSHMTKIARAAERMYHAGLEVTDEIAVQCHTWWTTPERVISSIIN